MAITTAPWSAPSVAHSSAQSTAQSTAPSAPSNGGTRRAQPRPRRERGSHLSDFTALTARIKAEGLLARSHGYYWAKLIGLPLALAGIVVLSFTLGDTWWQMALAVAFALVMAQVGYLGHDAAHRQIFASAKWNKWVSLIVLNLIAGMGFGWWQGKHNKHHAKPNMADADPDIGTGAFAYTPEGVRSRRTAFGRWITPRQSYYFFPLLLLAGLQLHINGTQRLLRRGTVKNRWVELAFIAIRHGALITFAFLAMSPVIAVSFLLVQVMVFGFYLAMTFAPNHIGMPILPKDVKIDFLRRQVLMSRNISGGRVVDTLMGGLNFQIEHHLFPSMSRPNLRRAAPIVREYCRDLGVNYHVTSLPRSYVEVASYLNRVGRGGIDLWSCPLAGALRTV